MLDSVVIGFGGGKPGYLATLWATWLNVPSVVLFRGNDFEKIIHDTKHGWMIHFILDQADSVGAVSREMVARIRSLRNGQTVFTPNGIDTTEWYLEKSDEERAQQWREEHVPDDKRVIGQLKFKKGLEMAVALLTVGDIPESIQESVEAGCGEHWIHVPFQQQEILPVYYAAADIVFLPSLYDGMPNVLLEVMALGKIVVASNAGGIPDVISDGVNGFLFEIGDYSGAARAMNKALTLSQDQKALMGKEARRTVEESFTSAREVEILEKMFYDLSPRSPERGDHGL
jgi:glycosyltransferase involved in cell wall biosynthesis